MLGYADFDGTFRDLSRTNRPPSTHPIIQLPALEDGLLRFEPHVRDGREGDPTWQGGKGKGLIGGLNYLSSQGRSMTEYLAEGTPTAGPARTIPMAGLAGRADDRSSPSLMVVAVTAAALRVISCARERGISLIRATALRDRIASTIRWRSGRQTQPARCVGSRPARAWRLKVPKTYAGCIASSISKPHA